MERMKICVERVDRDLRTNAEVGRVKAVSSRTLCGQPVAVLQIKIRVAVQPLESPQDTRRRLREEALQFLDPA